MNLAEVGIAAVRKQHNFQQISLVDASFKDLSFQMCQDERYLATVNNDESFIGKGLNYQQLIQRAHKAQVGRAHVYINALNTGDAFLKETVLEEHNTFQPNPSDNIIIFLPKMTKAGSQTIPKYSLVQVQVHLVSMQIHMVIHLSQIQLPRSQLQVISSKCPKNLKMHF